MVRVSYTLLLSLLAMGCASQRLSGGSLDRVTRPAFISRIDDEAGPRSLVFREDGAYREKLKKLDPKEADRRLQAKLAAAVSRFEISERLRVNTLKQLPEERPWTEAVDPARIATLLESYLVEEVPANEPDYELLVPLGVDAVVEFVVQEYGMRSRDGRAGPYIQGFGRMFWLKGRHEVWRRSFRVDAVAEGEAALDPFRVGKEPTLYRDALTQLLDGISSRFAEDLTPKDRRGSPLPAGVEQSAPDSTNRTGRQPPPPPPPPEDELPPGELPEPD
jgi:hypothetical protein